MTTRRTALPFRILLPAALTGLASLAGAAGEVRLVKATSTVMIDSARPGDLSPLDSTSTQEVYCQILVRNIAFEKSVTVFTRNDSAWDSADAVWARMADDDHELWELRSAYSRAGGGPPLRDLEFKVRYRVDSAEYWDDDGGSHYRLPMRGGTLLGRGVHVHLRSARWEMDTGAFADSTVLALEAEVRAYTGNSGFRVSWSTDRMKTAGLVPILEAPVPSWQDSAGLADSNKVYVYRVALKGIRVLAARNDFIDFHVNYWREGAAHIDNNYGNRYSLGLGWKLDQLDEEELPLPVSLRRPGARPAARGLEQARLRVRGTPAWAGSRGPVDGLGRLRLP